MDNTFFFLFVFSGRFWQENYVSMWGHYGSRIVIIFLRPFSETSCSIINILWWYKPSFYGGLCPIYFFGESNSNGSIFMLQSLYFW
jgi:hypothetical protein